MSKPGSDHARAPVPEAGREPIAVGGLFETHLTVRDLSGSVAFYRDVVGLPLALEVPERGAAFFWIGGAGEAMLGLWSLGSAPLGLALHVAFKAALEEVLGACERLRSLGVTPLSFFATETREPSVIGWMPAAAVYFRDPDGHLLEYLAMLDAPADGEAGVVPWSQWAARRDLAAPEPPVRVDRQLPGSEGRRVSAAGNDSVAQLDSYRRARQPGRRLHALGILERT